MAAKLSDEERAARAEARAEKYRLAKEAREAKRQANREAWNSNPANANNVWRAEQDELKAAAEIGFTDEPEPIDKGSLSLLRAIMLDDDEPLHTRIFAAETVLQYELAPDALASGSAEPVAATSYRFLRAVLDSPDTPRSLRLRSLRNIAAIENARAARVDGDQLAGKRDLLLALVNGERRRVLRDAGCGPGAAGWALSSADDVEWPEGWPGSWAWPPPDFGLRLDAAKLHPRSEGDREAWRAALRSVRARNRVDDWDRDIVASAA